MGRNLSSRYACRKEERAICSGPPKQNTPVPEGAGLITSSGALAFPHFISKSWILMARNVQDNTTETPRESTQAENSPDTFIILIVSMTVLVAIGVVILWYFGVLPGSTPPVPVQQ